MSIPSEIQYTNEENQKAFWFIYYGDKLMVSLRDERATIPFIEDLSYYGLIPVRSQHLGKLGNILCYCAEVETEDSIPKDMEFIGLRQLIGLVDEDIFWMAGKAFQIVDWDRSFQFCGKCGLPTHTMNNEYAKVCTPCNLINYPRISPAIIVAVIKDSQILLARGSRFPSGFYSVLAGFVEPGETLEECVAREVKEEVGLEVKNITYFGSQPWPFPNSLMLGFTAEYASGELQIDENEILDAGWFTAQNIPEGPKSISISRKLIDWFMKNNQE